MWQIILLDAGTSPDLVEPSCHALRIPSYMQVCLFTVPNKFFLEFSRPKYQTYEGRSLHMISVFSHFKSPPMLKSFQLRPQTIWNRDQASPPCLPEVLTHRICEQKTTIVYITKSGVNSNSNRNICLIPHRLFSSCKGKTELDQGLGTNNIMVSFASVIMGQPFNVF